MEKPRKLLKCWKSYTGVVLYRPKYSSSSDYDFTSSELLTPFASSREDPQDTKTLAQLVMAYSHLNSQKAEQYPVPLFQMCFSHVR